MTPMIDCTFNLLIFFLLTPALAMGEGFLTTNLPRTGPNIEPPERMPVCVRVELTGGAAGEESVSIVVNGAQSFGANFGALQASLEDMRARGLAAGTPVLIAPSMATRHKWVVKAFDAAVAARFSDIRFAVPY